MSGQPALANDDGKILLRIVQTFRALEMRVASLEAAVADLQTPISEVTVNCVAGESISDALVASSGSVPLTITVVGTCMEDPVLISRMWQTALGWVFLGIMLTFQYVGFKIIKKIVTIDI